MRVGPFSTYRNERRASLATTTQIDALAISSPASILPAHRTANTCTGFRWQIRLSVGNHDNTLVQSRRSPPPHFLAEGRDILDQGQVIAWSDDLTHRVLTRTSSQQAHSVGLTDNERLRSGNLNRIQRIAWLRQRQREHRRVPFFREMQHRATGGNNVSPGHGVRSAARSVVAPSDSRNHPGRSAISHLGRAGARVRPLAGRRNLAGRFSTFQLDSFPAPRANDYQATQANDGSGLDIFTSKNESFLDGSDRSCAGRQRALKQWGFDGMYTKATFHDDEHEWRCGAGAHAFDL